MEVNWLGLNNATWASQTRVDGTDMSALVTQRLGCLDPEEQTDPLFRRLAWIGHVFRPLPNSYLQYYFFHDEIRGELKAKPTSRADDIMAHLPDLYAGYAAEACKPDPHPSTERAGRGKHGDFAVNMMCAVMGDEAAAWSPTRPIRVPSATCPQTPLSSCRV